ncbi:YaeQ family protein [Erwinia sp. 9145]|uniref:YaeQ family protein n=1 Tax=Erwinia sp. 9145 TaxID=1500895 RepID=UPI000551451F|nr:YaeQ family protein [Erwinia sp. 9145]
MALKATIYKAAVNVADMDRSVFLDSNLTLARHPSETEERLMLRLVAWLVNAHERLTFTRGLSAEDEPEIWRMNDHNGIELWVELGLPDERRIKKACSRSGEVCLYTYNARAAQIWWQQNQARLAQQDNLTVRFLDDEQLKALTQLASRSMTLQATIQDGTIWLSDEQHHLELHFTDWLINGKLA